MTTEREEEIRRLRARLAELEAEEATTFPKAATSSGLSDATRQKGLAIAAVITVLLLVGWCISQQSASPNPPAAPAVETAQPAESPAPTQQPAPAAPASSWTYREDRDPMTDRMTTFACTTSSNRVHLNPPYDSVSAQLCIRQSPKFGLDAFVSLNGDGQIICRSYDGCTASVRFGENSKQNFSAADAADGSSNIVFITNASRFVEGLKTAPITRVELTFYEAGTQVIEFPTADLEWPRP